MFFTGVALVISGFVYEITFAGLQYQDETPQLHANYEHHAGIARLLQVSGVAVAFGAIFGGAAWGFRTRLSRGEKPYEP